MNDCHVNLPNLPIFPPPYNYALWYVASYVNISYNTGKSALPDKYAQCPRACST